MPNTSAAMNAAGTLELTYGGRPVDLSKPFARMTIREAILKYTEAGDNVDNREWLTHALRKLGFNMVAYPTTILFRVARTIERSLANIKAGKPMDADAVDFKDFKDITGFSDWARIEDTYKQAAAPPN